MNIVTLGLLGEWKAERTLKKKGMRILARRYRAGRDEIDLIARDGDMLVFVEVKYRPKGQMGDGAAFVTRQKKCHIIRAACHYLAAHPSPVYRFDVVEITAAGVRHIQNAF